MGEYKKTRSLLGVFICVVVIVVGTIFVYYQFFLTVPTFDEQLVEKTFDEDEDYCYFYEKLDQDCQKIYKNLLYGLQQFEEEILLPDVSVKQVQTTLEYVTYDHPELYYVNLQFQYQDMKKYIVFMPQYDYTQEKVEAYNKQIKEKTQQVISSVSNEDSLIKARKLYEYVTSENVYQNNEKIDQNIISSLIVGKTVCAGYARAYQYLMNRAGEQCAYIVGTANESNSQIQMGDGHAWTMLKMNGDYYYCDPTWGDNEENGYAHACYGYFMMNSDEMLTCYTPEVSYEKTMKGEMNYFKEESSYVSTYSKAQLSRIVARSRTTDRRVAELKCANRDTYKLIKNKLDNTYLGYEILSENHCYSSKARYACDDNLMLVEIYY